MKLSQMGKRRCRVLGQFRNKHDSNNRLDTKLLYVGKLPPKHNKFPV